MKKLMALALVAMLSSAVQAIDMDWTSWTSATATAGTALGTGGGGPNTSKSMAAIINVTGSAGNLITFQSANSANAVTISVSEAGYYTISWGSTSTTPSTAWISNPSGYLNTSIAATSDSAVTISASMTRSSTLANTNPSNQSSVLALTIMVNDTILFTTEVSGNTSKGTFAGGYWNNVTVATGDATGYTTDSTVSVYSIASYQLIPEPTSLALLALGVAGLALRRRA